MGRTTKNADLTMDLVQKVAKAYAQGATTSEVQARYGISQYAAPEIRHGKHRLQRKKAKNDIVRCPGCGGKTVLPCKVCTDNQDVAIKLLLRRISSETT